MLSGIARFPAAAQALVKQRVNAIALAPADEFRRDEDDAVDALEWAERVDGRPSGSLRIHGRHRESLAPRGLERRDHGDRR
jgi:hypothetical protein